MANPEHIEVARNGAQAITAWREAHPQETFDLGEADLSGCDLSGAPLLMAWMVGADLSESNMSRADLRSCNLAGADLCGADLSSASASGGSFGGADLRAARLEGIDLRGADLPEADLQDAEARGSDLRAAHLPRVDLHRANLRDADLRRCDLRGAMLADAILSGARLGEADLFETTFARTALDGADLAGARCGWTNWLDVDLAEVRGLDTVVHLCASTIGLDSVYRSRGRLPKPFLRGCGVAENLIVNVESLTRKAVGFFTCFISYAADDEAFARQLHDSLQSRGVRCWLDEKRADSEEDGVIRPFNGVRRWDKIVLCLSQGLLSTPSAQREIDAALATEEQLSEERGLPVEMLIPLDLDGTLYATAFNSASTDVLRSRVAADFTRTAYDNEKFHQQFEQLVRVLTANPGASDQVTLADESLAQLRLHLGRTEGLQSGFARLTRNDGGNNIWYNYRGEKVRSHHLRQLNSGSVMEWESLPVVVDPGSDFVNLVFAGAMGYRSQPATDGFAFLLNGRHILDFDLARDSRAWHSADQRVTLLYSPRWSSREDNAGFFYVAILRDLLTPGQPLRMAVRAKGSESLRWFSLHPEQDPVALQAEAGAKGL